ncbi:hypothetical protein HHI36_018212 [Cryptolaemus montrouzieri]|uniref:Uncharacterized protein n=1 Tax=Cryptolaemus montrouzieri TaxID=559131 RepID=A0ABD2NZG5_9CUCU
MASEKPPHYNEILSSSSSAYTLLRNEPPESDMVVNPYMSMGMPPQGYQPPTNIYITAPPAPAPAAFQTHSTIHVNTSTGKRCCCSWCCFKVCFFLILLLVGLFFYLMLLNN